MSIMRISIHAPREGSDRSASQLSLNRVTFQSTLPVRGATHWMPLPEPPKGISIHAPREGSDHPFPFPRSAYLQFQSTLPVRGATAGRLSVAHSSP